MRKIRLVNIVGTRPNFIKIAPFRQELKRRKNFEEILIHTGQHYSLNMSDYFIEELEIGEINYWLGVGPGTQMKQIGKIMVGLEKLLPKLDPDIVVVVGDVNSTMASALVVARLGLRLAHIEAGLRSFVKTMPEEQNRVIVDHFSDLLFTHSAEADQNLIREGIPPDRIFNVGNIMIDTLILTRSKWQASRILEKLGVQPKSYAVCTLHRSENVDNPETFAELLRILDAVQRIIPVVFPIHPRSKMRIDTLGLKKLVERSSNLILIEPLGYFDFMKLTENSAFVLTDSGGIQEETSFLSLPCLTLRDETERPVTVNLGTNIVVGRDKKRVLAEVNKILNGKAKKGSIPPLWDGKTSKRIADIIEEKVGC